MSIWQQPQLPFWLKQHLQQPKTQPAQPPTAQPAAVLLPLHWHASGWQLLLTQRSELVRTHKGQVALPGGKPELNDRSRTATALRETWEEIGLPSEAVQVLGELPPFLGGGEKFWLCPVAAVVPATFPYKPNPAETARVFSIPLAWLADPKQCWQQSYRDQLIWFYQPYEGITLWGMTAQVVQNFVQICHMLDTGGL